jgi:hypothetical protein
MAHEIVGYWASAMVFLTFLTKDMRLLRILAIFSNVGFVTYGYLYWLPPVFCLHLFLLPVNTVRLREILQSEGYQTGDLWAEVRRLVCTQSARRVVGCLFG